MSANDLRMPAAADRGSGGSIETVTCGYDARHRMTSVTAAFGTTSYTLLKDGMADKDVLPRVGDPPGAQLQRAFTWTYQYDERDQLTSAIARYGNGEPMPGRSLSYAFDGIGNHAEAGWTYNAANQLTAMPGRTGTFDYDDRGNLTDDRVFTYTWDAENHLLSATKQNPASGSKRVTFAYDSEGRRISKKIETYDGSAWSVTQTLTFAYDGWNLLAE